jgi:DNA-directed RNA polymerase subunit E"
MSKEKVCKNCNMIYEGDRCPGCGSQEYTEEIKGRLVITDPEKSEIAKNVGINKKGTYAIKAK